MAEAENKTLIFTETKKRADELTMRMRREGSVMVSACASLVRTGWLGSVLFWESDLWFDGHGFDLELPYCQVTVLGKLFTLMCLCH